MTRFSFLQASALVLLTASLAVNGLQGTRILRLERALDAAVGKQPLPEGSEVPPIDAMDNGGAKLAIDFAASQQLTVLYVLSPSCIWCRQNAPAFRAFEQQLGKRVRLVGLSLSNEGLKEFVDGTGISIPIYTPSESAVRTYHLGETPTTLVISRDGVVKKRWAGAYIGTTGRSIEKYFGIQLPIVQ